jgi:hypothetical protein
MLVKSLVPVVLNFLDVVLCPFDFESLMIAWSYHKMKPAIDEGSRLLAWRMFIGTFQVMKCAVSLENEKWPETSLYFDSILSSVNYHGLSRRNLLLLRSASSA